jgi:hypothetical protein
MSIQAVVLPSTIVHGQPMRIAKYHAMPTAMVLIINNTAAGNRLLTLTFARANAIVQALATYY